MATIGKCPKTGLLLDHPTEHHAVDCDCEYFVRPASMETIFTLNYTTPARVDDTVTILKGKHTGETGRVLRSYLLADSKGAGRYLRVRVTRKHISFSCSPDFVEVQA